MMFSRKCHHKWVTVGRVFNPPNITSVDGYRGTAPDLLLWAMTVGATTLTQKCRVCDLIITELVGGQVADE